MRKFDPDGKWDDHIRLVFSVFVGVSIAQAFDFAANPDGPRAHLLLFGLTCYVVLDNWYHLNMDLRIVDISSAYQLSFCLAALITYSCFPFLYGVRSELFPGFGAPEWMLINLALVCITDAMLKAVIWRKLHAQRNELSEPLRLLYGEYMFFALSGAFYAAVITGLLVWHFDAGLLTRFWNPALIVVALWGVIRALDYLLVRRIADWLFRTFTGT